MNNAQEFRHLPELERFGHDLRQYVAAGKLIASQAVETREEAAGRLSALGRILGCIEGLAAEASGEVKLRPDRCDLVEVLTQCVAVVQAAHEASFELVGPRSIVIACDATLVRRAVTNVLDNAGRAAGPSGNVQVRVDKLGHHVVIAVEDDGVGFGGVRTVTGIGMTVVWESLHRLGGRLEILSGPGSGTTVRLILPRRQLGAVA